MTSLTPSRLAFARTQLAICQPTVEFEIIESSGLTAPVEVRTASPAAERGDLRIAGADRAVDADGVPGQTGLDLGSQLARGGRDAAARSVAALAFGFLSERYWFFTQRPVPL